MNDGPIVEVLGADEAEVRQRRAAGALAAAGLEPGDRVAFVLPSSAALLCAVLGALRTGMVPVLLNATLVPTERELLLADARPSLSIVDDGALAALDRGTPVDLSPYPLARPMHYTSGTTGRAKGVWTGIWDQPTAAAAFRDEADLWDFGPGDVHLVCSPMYHSVSIRFAAGTLMSGGTCVVLSRFDAAAALAALSGKAGVLPTTTFMAPAALHRLLSLGSALPARFDSLRLLVHAGSPCPPVVKRAAMERVRPDVLWEFYGSTEGQFTACSSAEWTERPGTVGRARVGRRLTVDDDGTVWCHPPSFARFLYWDDEAKTAAAWRDGSFTVGDIGRLDSDGYLFLDGRRDDLIISGGVNVYPAEVEAALAEVPGVSEIAVFGLPDETWGERVCAAVVPDRVGSGPVGDGVVGDGVVGDGAARDGAADDGAFDVGLLRAHAEVHLAPYKRPKEYVVTHSLPRTATGKLQRRLVPGVLGFGGGQ